ncbi:MAG: hypothetical protein B7Y43_12565 [Sphingomonas sp. 28-62-20]|uniref:copper homeostasis membrane protein CopD n=1 Tax=Sphingomonas sp. 28-62-20 TaxID=1970433 RepID=UPI000BCFA6C9|nr:MAG: hypothetical protein B7Y43_12565 [Sphingomonas sp. 28-62-20]
MSDPLYIGIRFALYADLMLLFGLPFFAIYTPGERGNFPHRRRVLGFLAVLGIALSALSIAAMTASMAGVSLLQVDRASIVMMVSDTPMGTAWAVRMAALTAVAISALIKAPPVPVAVLGAIALGTLAWTGHGSAGEGNAGIVQFLGDLAHLLAAGAWLGALVALSYMVWAARDAAATQHALARFASAGTLIVAAIIGSGLINGVYLVGWSNLGMLPRTSYGQLLILKIALFCGMLVLAALNRFRLTPALHAAIEPDGTVLAWRELRLSLILELSLAAAILGLVAWLGTLEPPMSM